jgi:alkyl sulfatase BDS1-like metallo-beta-lactamase superfamily hydrolase
MKGERIMKKLLIAFLAMTIGCFLGNGVFAEGNHFDPKGNAPSKFTVQNWEDVKNKMPFKDKRDFEEQKKGFIAAPEYKEIMADAGHVAWSMGKYAFLLEGKEYQSIHPSLQRQAVLNMNYGLYEVIPGIYQVRGFDLANITFIKGKTGWIVFDPLTAKETARAALKLINEHKRRCQWQGENHCSYWIYGLCHIRKRVCRERHEQKNVYAVRCSITCRSSWAC